MMKRACLLSFLSAGFLAGCAAASPPDQVPVEEENTTFVSQELNGLDACPGTVWIGKLAGPGACPQQAESPWLVTPMFPDASGDLSRYCQVAWMGPWTGPESPKLADFQSLPEDPTSGDPGTVWLDRDCHVVAGLSPTEDAREAVAPSLMETFAAALEAPIQMAYPPAADVQVAIIDSWPSANAVGRSSHGFGMASIVSGLACPTAGVACPVHVSPALALNLTASGEVDNTNGGYFGFQGRIASAVYGATQTWVTAGKPGNLILNLSLGWDERYNLDEENVMSSAVLAVRDALEYARCQGALVLAAAGNASGGGALGIGPMFPAAWEAFPVTACLSALGSPLVRAVGGVDATGALLPSARPGGMPRLVADGYLVPTKGSVGGPDIFAGPFSGTSVSTAGATAVAAAVWALNAGFTADEVVSHLYTTGVGTGAGAADFCWCSAQPGCTCPNVRRISMCNALGLPAWACRNAPSENPMWSQQELQEVASYNLGVVDGTDLVTPVINVCDGTVYTIGAAAGSPAEELCPAEVLPNETIVPFSTPQPGVPICGACGLYWRNAPGESTLEIAVNEELGAGTLVYPATLALHDDAGVAVARYDIGSQAPLGLLAGQVYKFLLPGMDGSQLRYAILEWARGVDDQTTSDVALVAQPGN